jgi:N-acetylglucosamine-6-phosphate deacetylase
MKVVAQTAKHQSGHAYCAAQIFDGQTMHHAAALVVAGASVRGVVPVDQLPADMPRVDLGQGLLVPGLVDLQVNGGGGRMFNLDQSVATLGVMADAHARFGTTAILPTLITDTRDRTIEAIQAVGRAVAQGLPGIAGLHLEGPHLSVARKGAHDPLLIRPMKETDLARLCQAAQELPALMITLAVESVSPDQISRLVAAGAVVSLGHSDASFEQVTAAVRAGARSVTHLFNAMSALGNRAPGMVGAALDLGELSAGLIADGHHVHPASLRAALRAKQGPGAIYLVSDAMATVGGDLPGFELNGRPIMRRGGRLELSDGTLAGADVDLLRCARNIATWGGQSVETALLMAGLVPARLMGLARHGHLCPGARADFLLLGPEMALRGVWRDAVAVNLFGALPRPESG